MLHTLGQPLLASRRTRLSKDLSHEEFGGEAGADDDVSVAADLSVQGAGEGGGVLKTHATHELQLVEFPKLSEFHFLQVKR